jgi:hypothetical protein
MDKKNLYKIIETKLGIRKDIEQQIDNLLAEFISSKQWRVGGAPCKDSMNLMRNVALNCLKTEVPIPVLIPIAPCKIPLSAECPLDFAECFMIKCLIELQDRISKIYGQGLEIRMRIEDLTILYLYPSQSTQKIMEQYISDLNNLVNILGGSEFITLVKESDIMNVHQYVINCNENKSIFMEYIRLTDGKETEIDNDYYRELLRRGWRGPVSKAMRTFLLHQYSIFHPEMNTEQKHELMCKYLSCILVRKQMNGAGSLGKWDQIGRWEITFTTPLPDCPIISTRLHYRCMPYTESKMVVPPWRAKCIIKNQSKGTDDITFGLVSINTPTTKNGEIKLGCTFEQSNCVALPLYVIN